jgi:hypothetical protein
MSDVASSSAWRLSDHLRHPISFQHLEATILPAGRAEYPTRMVVVLGASKALLFQIYQNHLFIMLINRFDRNRNTNKNAKDSLP